MVVIVWEFRVRLDRLVDFERIYGPDGDWDRLFKTATGFIGTELLRDRDDHSRFFTIDTWSSQADFEAFVAARGAEYASIDARAETLTESEERIGAFETIGDGGP